MPQDEKYDLAGIVIGCAMKVHSALGPGFLESVYRNALVIELREAGYRVEVEKRLSVYYHEHLVGEFIADLIVDGTLIVELKAIQTLTTAHEVQLVNYLTATKIDEGLLLNFGAERLEFKKKFRVYRRKQP
ncbi:MAG: GxxExxY protein [Anaerolineae bacterium]|nr:GxxExxY protein [Candidatus Roseilinea sp.]MDW8450450.1 GxxExxY protein [Anaerolineae bacterium]